MFQALCRRAVNNKMLAILFIFLAFLHNVDCTKANISSYACEPGWELVTSDPTLCAYLSDDKYGFQAAVQACGRLGARLIILRDQNLENFIYGKAVAVEYWFALRKPSGYFNEFRWLYNDRFGSHRLGKGEGRFLERFPYSAVIRGRDESCAMLVINERGWLGISRCTELKNYICTKRSKCAEGYYGLYCEHQCHCHGQLCNNSGMCEYGCQPGWTGAGCNLKVEPAEVTYYCFNTTTKGARMLLHIDTKALDYKVLSGLDGDLKPVADCGISTFKYNSNTRVFTKELTVQPSQAKTPLCGERKTGPTTWVWQFALREIDGVQSLNDVTFKVTCDFSKADGLAISSDDNLKVSGKVTSDVKDIEVKKEDVTLTLVDPVTQAELEQAELGTFVQLRFQLNKHSGLSVKGVSPFNCHAFSSDGKFTKQLSDTRGCSSDRQPYLAGNATVQTRLFPLFAFPGSAVINFRCEYEFCFKNDMRCTNRCRLFINNGVMMRRKRSSTAKKPVYTTIKVLSPKEELAVDAPPETPDKLRGVPLLYLNPITCSMFLFLLSVFLLYYVFFIKSLKKAVDEMKQELKLQNRWQRL